MPDNIYDLIMSADEPSAAQKAANMAALLRREQTAGQLMQMHPLLRQMGSSILQTSGQGMNQLAGAGDTRFAGRQRQQMQDSQQTFTAGENQKNRDAEARQGALNRALARERMKAAAAAGAGGPDLKEQLQIEKLRQEVTGENPGKVAAAEASLARMRGLIGQLRDIHSGKVNPATGQREGGVGTELTGNASKNMGQLMTAIQIEAKNLAELGALSGPDMALMEKLTGGDPSSLGENLKSMLTLGLSDSTDSNLDQLENWSKGAADAARRVYGGQAPIAPRQMQQPAATPAAAPATGGGDLVMVVPPGSSTPVPVHRSKLDAAVAAGGRVVGG